MELGRIGIWSFQLRDAREGMREAAGGLDDADEPADHRDLPMAHLLPESHHRRDPRSSRGLGSRGTRDVSFDTLDEPIRFTEGKTVGIKRAGL
jgi:hypothetical protein